jgi:hypothetical protein
MRGRARRWVAAGLVLSGAACSAPPLPLAGRAGTTVGIAVGSDLLEGPLFGFGASTYDAFGISDDQRGRLVFELDTRAVTGAALRLDPRVVTRVVPDPATGLALEPDAHLLPLAGVAQVLALVDIPADAPVGVFDLRIRRVDRAGGPLAGPSYLQRFEVLPNPGGGTAHNPFLVFHPHGSLDLLASGQAAGLYPWPKLVLALVPGTGGAPLHAAHLSLAYPADRVDSILRVYDDRRSDHGAIVQWRADIGSGRVAIDWIAPEPTAFHALAVVFRPREPFAGPVAPADFPVLEAAFYDADGRQTPGRVGSAQIR